MGRLKEKKNFFKKQTLTDMKNLEVRLNLDSDLIFPDYVRVIDEEEREREYHYLVYVSVKDEDYDDFIFFLYLHHEEVISYKVY